jgi:CMP-N,N'-diacetyllegionaminic acid synthase
MLALVTARGGSKRLPGKNIRSLAGRSLLARTAAALEGSRWRESPCLLSTDDPQIRDEGLKLGWLVPWLRPAEFATDSASSVDAALHALDWWRGMHGADPEVLLLLQPTSPFRGSSVIDAAVEMLMQKSHLNAVVGMRALHCAPRSLFTRGRDGSLSQLSDAAAPTPLLTPNGALYAIRPHALRTWRTFTPSQTAAIEMDAVQSIDIDTLADWTIAEALAARLDWVAP